MRFVFILLFFCLHSKVSYPAFKQEWAVVAVPVADVRSTSASLPNAYAYDPQEETQLLYGEIVKIISEQGDWLQIEAVEQPEFSHNNRWQGYPGWIKRDTIVPAKKILPANFVVRKKRARLFSAPNLKSSYLPLSLGTRINNLTVMNKNFWKIRTVAGKIGWMLRDEARLIAPALPEEFARKIVIESASEFLGDDYFWGGRSAHIPELKDQITAVDCSGLVNLAYRVAGMDVPRDSYEQFLKAKKIKREDLKMGDLIFSASKDHPEKISHVAIFIDEKTLIEAPQTGAVVRKIEFEKKFGAPLEQIQSGQIIGDRILYFGTFF